MFFFPGICLITRLSPSTTRPSRTWTNWRTCKDQVSTRLDCYCPRTKSAQKGRYFIRPATAAFLGTGETIFAFFVVRLGKSGPNRPYHSPRKGGRRKESVIRSPHTSTFLLTCPRKKGRKSGESFPFSPSSFPIISGYTHHHPFSFLLATWA